MASKLVKNKAYWDRKNEAFRNFGKAETRPQSNFRLFLLDRRRLNLGYRTSTNEKIKEIDQFSMSHDRLPACQEFILDFIPYKHERWSFVDDESSMKSMLQRLETLNEITLDVEENKDHSYTGMTCLLQLGTCNMTYLLDPFPLFVEIKEKLKTTLESPNIIKIMHGCANDITGINRDFSINLVGVVDVQILHRKIMEIFYHATERLYIDESFFDNEGIVQRATGFSGDSLPTRDDLMTLKRLSSDGISLKKLGKIYFPDYCDPVDATLADWRIRPLKHDMINYAVYDVHLLMGIWQKMKALIGKTPNYNAAIQSAISETNKLLKKPVPVKSSARFEDVLAKVPKNMLSNTKSRTLLEALHEFRENHAKVIDEPSAEVFNDHQIINLLKQMPQSPDEVVQCILKTSRVLPESIESWKKPVSRILTEGEIFWEKMKMSKNCHVCGGLFDYPHMAWEFIQEYSQEAVNRYMKKAEHQSYQQKEYNRRLNNWKKKHGDIPCPYLKPPTN